MEATHKKTATRAPTPAAPVPAPVATAIAARVQLQNLTRVSSPHDAAEREAEATARKVMRMPSPALVGPAVGPRGLAHRQQSPSIARFADALPLIRRKGDGATTVSPATASEIAHSSGAGSPLPPSTRQFMEARFSADFRGVRIHTGDRAAKLSRQLNAQAFTVGPQIFFGKERFQPHTAEGRELIAHELTHTIQQGAAIQRRADATVGERAAPQVQRLGVSDALDYFADAANGIPGYRMFTILLGLNPINMARVERSAANVLRAVVEFIPGGALITRALDAYGVFDRVGSWVDEQLRSLGITGSLIRDAITRFLDGLGWSDILDLGGVWDRAKRIFTEPIERIIAFARNLATAILRFIREAILRPLAGLASRTRAWDLLCALMGENPITGEAVPRTAETLIGGFMKLIGQEEIWENIKRGNAIARAWAWFQGASSALLGFVRQIPGLFIRALESLEITDLVLLPRAFERVASVFGGFIADFLRWAGEAMWSLLEIVFSVVAPGLMVYVRRAAAAFRTIIADPIAFVRNLVRAAMQGFRQFATNFLTHLRASLVGWLTGAMSGAGIHIPQAFTLQEILKFVLSVLGLTWQNVRQKLVRAIGETAVAALETGFDIVMTLVTQGPAAAWEKIVESVNNLREMVIEQVMTFVRDRIVQAAITRLLSLLSPAGAFIQAIIATYNTIMFFVERLQQIAQVAASFIDAISAIANGVIGAAANRVEQTMAGLLTLVISFLARIAGLGRVSDAVTNVINQVRAPIDRALDRVVEWIVQMVQRAGRFIVSRAQAAGRAVLGWLGLRRSFRSVDGEQHSIYFRQVGNQAELMRASGQPTEILVYLDTLTYPGTDPRANQLTRAKVLAGSLRLLTRTPAPGQVATTPQQEEQIVDAMTRLSELLMQLVNMSLSQLPPAADWTQRAKSNAAHHSKVYMLASPSARGGSAASGTSPEYELASTDQSTVWVRMHLLPYSIGGSGNPSNWVPAPSNINSGGPMRSFETALEAAVRSVAIPPHGGMRARPTGPPRPNVLWVETAVDAFRAPVIDVLGRSLHFAERVLLRFGLYRPDGTGWVKLNDPQGTQNITIPPPPDGRIRLASASGTAMRNSGLQHLSGSDYSDRLVDAIKDVRGSGFATYAELESRLLAATTTSRLLFPARISQIVADLRTNRRIRLQ